MPKFILGQGDADTSRRFNALDDFTQGYIEAMFFTSTGSGNDDDMEDATVAEMALETWQKIIDDCTKWQRQNTTILALAAQQPGYGMMKAGRDYWYTRNGHGVGFWDREELEAAIIGINNETNLAEVLTERCEYRGLTLYRGDDGLLYLE